MAVAARGTAHALLEEVAVDREQRGGILVVAMEATILEVEGFALAPARWGPRGCAVPRLLCGLPTVECIGCCSS